MQNSVVLLENGEVQGGEGTWGFVSQLVYLGFLNIFFFPRMKATLTLKIRETVSVLGHE